jgi:diguanylate cyclase (GGDEF)-like protein
LKESVKELILQNKNLFKEDDNMFDLMLDMADDSNCDDDRMDQIIVRYIESIQHHYEQININALYDYVTIEEEALTMQQLDKECSRSNRYHHKLCLILVQLSVNHSVGTLDPDRVLNVIGNALRSNLRRTDCVGKYKMDKMLILLPNTGVEESLLVIEKLKQRIEETCQLESWNIREVYSLTEFVRWEDYELLLKRLEHGVIKGTQTKKSIVRL